MRLRIFLLLFIASRTLANQVSCEANNDFLYDCDEDYTHGTRIEYHLDSGWRFGVQQQMYTPTDLRPSDPVPGRHPYAGYLAGFVGYDNRGRSTWYDDVELQLGVLGPSSHADEVQRWVHKVLGCKYPAGWEHQLHDEAEVELSYWKGLDLEMYRKGDFGVIGDVELGGLLGTYQIAAGANADLKIGLNPSNRRGDSEMSVRGPSGAPAKHGSEYEAYLVFGLEGRCWGRNELMDGNAGYVHNGVYTTIDKETWTGAAKAGFTVGYGSMRVNMLWLWLTKQFETQEAKPHYASMIVEWSF